MKISATGWPLRAGTGIISAGILLLWLADCGKQSHKPLSITLLALTTNSEGNIEAVFELRNEAADCLLEPAVLVAIEEELGEAAPETMKQVLARQHPYTATYVENGREKYLAVKSFAPSPAEVRGAQGVFKAGETRTTSLRVPSEKSWKLLFDCSRPEPMRGSRLRHRLIAANAWANARLGLPLFVRSSWSHRQIHSPVFPSAEKMTDSSALHLGRTFEY